MDNHNLRQAGLKVTLPRLKILELLEKSHTRHLSAEDIYRVMLNEDEDIGLATIYRVLTQFEQAGLVVRHHFEGGHAVFELEHGAHHDHIVCINCGQVSEFVDEIIEQRQHARAEEMGFALTEHRLTLYGECQKTNCPHKKPKKYA